MTAKNSLAVTLGALGDLEGAEELLRAVLASREELLGPNHAMTVKA